MTTYTYTDKDVLTFDTEVSGGGLILGMQTGVGAPNVVLAHGDVVKDDIDIVGAANLVTIKVNDSATHTMEVYHSGYAAQWTRAGSVSQYQFTIPAGERDESAAALLIVAKSGGEVAARRSQIVIIRHRPTP